MGACVDCATEIPDGQRTCSMCYGDPGHGTDGIYAAWIEEREREMSEERQIEELIEQVEAARDIPGRVYIGISGTRDYYPDDELFKALSKLQATHGANLVLVFGDADGVDKSAWDTAQLLSIMYIREKAYWDTEGRGAGHKRNGRIVARVSMLLAYLTPRAERGVELLKASPGTCDCITQALDKPIPVHAFHQGRWLPPEDLASIQREVHRKRAGATANAK